MPRTIRFKLAAAFTITAIAAATIGVVAMLVVRITSDLVVRMYDQPLQAINYARLAQTSFVMMDREIERAMHKGDMAGLDMEGLSVANDDFMANLDVAEQRGLNPQIADYGKAIRAMNAAWMDSVKAAMVPDVPMDMAVMEKQSADIISKLEIVTQMAAEDGYKFRLQAEETIQDAVNRTLTVVVLLLALVIAVTVALIRNIVVPLDSINRVMIALAGGNLAITVPHRRRGDEIGRVAAALEVFRGAMSDLDEARQRAEAATRAKSEFLAMMSHEIRTPMNGVLGLTRLLLKSGLKEDQEKLATTVLDSGQSLLRILNDILDFSKLEAGKADIEKLDFELESLVAGSLMLMRNRAEEKGLYLHSDFSPDLPAYLKGDPNRLRQVMLNLIGNAIKFTETGGVTLSVGMVGEGRLRVTVADTGIGIDEAGRAKLFASFAQADSSITRRFGGTGLGLAICRKLVEAMGGMIGVDSTPGQGSQFWFELPMVEGQPVLAAAQMGDMLPALPPLKLLIADDNEVNRRVIGGLLAGQGHDIAYAVDGRQALDAVGQAQKPFDLVLMDVHMPVMDGISAARAIRALPDDRANVIIVAATASVGPDGIRRCLDAGMNAHIVKPVDPANMFAVLHRLFGQGPAEEPVAQTPTIAQALDADDRPFHPDILAELVAAMGAEITVELIDTFLLVADEIAPQLTADADPATLSDTAHSLKSAAGSLGLAAIYRAATALEGRKGDAAELHAALMEGAAWLRERRTELLADCVPSS
jgi:signal transduction histidine kinase/CheY-like chemotaxis protein/HPt (histidine-containing phosphotransfer) domain-containing protein